MQRSQKKNVSSTASPGSRGKSKARSSNPRPTKRRKVGVTLQGRPSAFNRDPLPTAFSFYNTDPTWLRMEGKVSHPELGGGVRIAGRQLFCSVTTTAGDSQLFVTNGATVATINTILVSPDQMNGKLALQARNYDRYAFRKLAFEYVPRIPTTQAGSFAMAYVADPNAGNLSPTFASITSMCPCIQSSFHGGGRRIMLMAVDDMNNPRTYFTLTDASTTVSLRSTVQGTLCGAPDVTSIGAVNMGFIYVDYLIDLYQPTLDQGFSLRLTEEENESILKKRRDKAAAIPPLSPTEEIGQLQLRLQQLKSLTH
jgi:hypothetical protein